MKVENRLKYRMYGLVPYNISPIQQGIQFGHAVVEYGLKHYNSSVYQEWAQKDKTFIILNGGTTNLGTDLFNKGTLNQHLDTLNEMGVPVATFYEPDLGGQLTAIVFLVEERIWNREITPSFRDFMKSEMITSSTRQSKIKKMYKDLIGGEYILKLREFIDLFRLA